MTGGEGAVGGGIRGGSGATANVSKPSCEVGCKLHWLKRLHCPFVVSYTTATQFSPG